MKTKKILDIALANEDPIVLMEVTNNTAIKYIGTNSIDLYINTSKTFAAKIIEKNILKIKEAVKEIDDKVVKDIYINNIKYELNLKEIYRTDDKASLISLDSMTREVTNEMSGENDIIGDMFEYESSVLNKTKINLALYNKELGKEWKEEINTSVIRNKFSMKRKSIIKQLQQFLDLKYEPSNNDTKEVIELLGLKK